MARTYVTARDLANLAAATIRDFPDLYKQYYSLPSFTWGKQIGNGEDDHPGEPRSAARQDRRRGWAQDATHTDEALYGFTGSASQNGRRLIMVVAGLPTFNSRIEESVRFMDWGFKAWRAQPLFKAGRGGRDRAGAGRLDTADRSRRAQDLRGDHSRTTSATQSRRRKVVYRRAAQGARSPRRQIVAHLVVDAGDGTPQSLPLAASRRVSEGGFFARLWTGFLSFFG